MRSAFRLTFSKKSKNPSKKTAIFRLYFYVFCNALIIKENNFKNLQKMLASYNILLYICSK